MICPMCHEEFVPETETWARNTVLGEDALGRDPNITSEYSPWYGHGYWRPCDVEEYEIELTDRCSTCEDRRLAALERAREYSSSCEPGWFDPGYAGETWSENDY